MKLDTILSKPWQWLKFSSIGFPDKGFIGHYNFHKANAALGYHTHDCIEICYLAKGIQVYEVGGQCYQMKGNDLFMTRPSQEHSSGGYPQDKGILYWMQVAVPKESELFLGLSGEHVRPLFKQLLAIPSHHFRGSHRCKRILDELILAYYNAPDAMRQIAVSTKVVEYLLEVARCAVTTFSRRTNADIADIIDYIENNLCEQISISDLAQITRLSESHFKTKFKQEIGIPPAEYILRRKVVKAKQLLSEEKMSITYVAFFLSFSSSQYFATVFKRFTLMTPTEFLRKSQLDMSELRSL